MKKIKLLGWAFVALFMCTNFIACNSSDDEDEISKSKKIVEIRTRYYAHKFSYNNKGLLDSITDADGDDWYHAFTWHNDYIEEKFYYGGSWRSEDHKGKYYLTNNTIFKIKYESNDFNEWGYEYKYNTSKKLNLYYENYDSYVDSVQIVWENNRIIEWGDTKFIYGEETCKGYVPLDLLVGGLSEEPELYTIHPELLNIRTNQLPIKIIRYGEECPVQYSFDEDGYIRKISLIYRDNNRVMAFTWE